MRVLRQSGWLSVDGIALESPEIASMEISSGIVPIRVDLCQSYEHGHGSLGYRPGNTVLTRKEALRIRQPL
jgi:hypothetical protein